jgi:hypothetical protein
VRQLRFELEMLRALPPRPDLLAVDGTCWRSRLLMLAGGEAPRRTLEEEGASGEVMASGST